jgi:hypothetical protein
MFASLIIPCIVAGVAVFVFSAVIWMVVRWHDKDIQQIFDEQSFIDAMKVQGLSPGLYMWPHCGGERDAHKCPEFRERWSKGPWGTVNILKTQPNFARNLIGTLLINLAVAFGVGMSVAMVLSGVQMGSGVLITCSMCQVFVPVFILGMLIYCLGGVCNDLFLGKPTRFIGTTFLDGLIFAGVQAVVLWAMWP